MKNVIYTYWDSGFENAPEIVKICHNSVIQHSTSANIVSLNESNIDDYVDFPGYIMDKYRSGVISKTNFSDLLRTKLIRNHGGLWADATMLFTRDICINEIFSRDLFIFKYKEANFEKITGRWTMFLMGGRPSSTFFTFLDECWDEYWKCENDLITYLLIDYFIYEGYVRNSKIRESLDAAPTLNNEIDLVQKKLSKNLDEESYRKMLCADWCCKLTYKRNFAEYTKDGKITCYGRIKEEYGNIF